MEDNLAKGFSLGVELIGGDRNGVLVHEAAGLARQEPDANWELDTIVDVASLTKVVATASAVLKCRDRGLLDLDAPLKKYLPSISHEGGDITLKELAAHNGGFNYESKFMHQLLDGKAPDFASAILEQRPVRKPGEGYVYTCIDMILLGFLVEAVTGFSLDEFCAREIFDPLGMRDSSFGAPGKRNPRLAKMINVAPGIISDPLARYAEKSIGNAGLFSTASDLARYCRMLLCDGELDGARILSKAAVAAFEQAINPPGLRPRSFGWDMGEDMRPAGMTEKAFFHTGWTGQSLFVDRGSGLFVAVLSNRRGEPAECRQRRTEIASALVKHMQETMQH